MKGGYISPAHQMKDTARRNIMKLNVLSDSVLSFVLASSMSPHSLQMTETVRREGGR